MDSALLFLWKLRFKAFFRRLTKTLRTAKGIGLTLLGLLVFVPWLISLFVGAKSPPMNIEAVRRFGPLLLLAYAFMSMLVSTSERALFFSPAEIEFLFSGPFSRKALLRYKVYGLIWGCLFSSIIMVLAFGRANNNIFTSYIAIMLALLFFQFLAMAVGLASNTITALANNYRRRIVLGVFVALIVGTIISSGMKVLKLPPIQALQELEASPALQAATLPFKPFIRIFTADRLSLDLLLSTSICLTLNAVMLLLIFAIDAQYLESVAISSAKIYDRAQRLRKGDFGTTTRRPKLARFKLGMLPWCGGIGPIFWRQLASAAREPLRVSLVLFAVLATSLFMLFAPRNRIGAARANLYMGQGLTLYLSVFLSRIIAFDFRCDVDRIDHLKTLPIRPVALVIGQILTPALVFAIPQWIGLAVSSMWISDIGEDLWAVAGLAFPLSVLIFGIDNWLFLLFPTRVNAASPADITAFGRQILLIFAKILGLFLTIGTSALVGLAVFYLLGTGRGLSLAITVCVATCLAASLIPLVTASFLRYDVVRDTPP